MEVNGEPRFADPYYGLLFTDVDGRLAPLNKVVNEKYWRHGYASPQYEGAIMFGSPGTRRELATVLALLGAPAVVRFSLAQTLWSAGSYAQAEREILSLMERYPDSGWAAAASYFLGDVYYRRSDSERARSQWLHQVDNPSLPSLQRLYQTRSSAQHVDAA